MVSKSIAGINFVFYDMFKNAFRDHLFIGVRKSGLVCQLTEFEIRNFRFIKDSLANFPRENRN